MFYSIVGNAVIRGVFEDYYHGQLPPSFEPIFLSPTNAAIIGAIGAPIYVVVGIMGWTIYYARLSEDDLEDLEDSLNEQYGADYGLARARHRASLWPLLSLSFGITAGAMIFRFRDPAISVGYSALCGWAGVVVLLVPLALSDVLLGKLASKLGPACAFMDDILYTHLGKGCELWTVAAEAGDYERVSMMVQ